MIKRFFAKIINGFYKKTSCVILESLWQQLPILYANCLIWWLVHRYMYDHIYYNSNQFKPLSIFVSNLSIKLFVFYGSIKTKHVRDFTHFQTEKLTDQSFLTTELFSQNISNDWNEYFLLTEFTWWIAI